jgi:hypothetical protein
MGRGVDFNPIQGGEIMRKALSRLGFASVALVVAFGLTGCMLSVYSPAIGLLYTEVYGPIDAGATVGNKEGMSCAQSVLGLVATGDASIKEAARDGGITKIASVDHLSKSILGIIGEFCTIVRGS